MNTNGNTLLITGATSGIGYELTKKFLALGNDVIGTGRNIEKLSSISSDRLTAIACDLQQQNDVMNLAEVIRSSHPSLNVIINNAGVQLNYDLLTDKVVSSTLCDELFVNLITPVILINELLPGLIEKKESAIVNISSGLALSPKKSAPTYCAAKAGLSTYSRALRYQLESTGVNVMDVLLPLVDTPMTEGRGSNKISPSIVADHIMRGLLKGESRLLVGKVKLLSVVKRISPAMAYGILKNG